MQTSSKSLSEIIKELENDWNKRLYSLTNSVPFITMAGAALEHHLDNLTVIRVVTAQWLEVMCFPSRDEVAEIAKRIIKIEDRIDSLDESLFQMLEDTQIHHAEISQLLFSLKGGKNEMADKKESDIKKEASTKTTKRRRNALENSNVENEANKTEIQEPVLADEHQQTAREENADNVGQQEQNSSLDILWNHAFHELDQWAKHADFRDDVFLKEAMYFAESISRNQENIKSVTEQFSKEFAHWERTAREEILMSTTALQHIFPKKSYEEINQQIDQIQSRTTAILRTPLQMAVSNQLMDQYLQMIDQYIALRKNGRKHYINTLKQAASLIYESQKGFINLFSGQLKALMFPLNKYMEKAEELTKS